MPSALKSPTAMERGPYPASKAKGASKPDRSWPIAPRKRTRTTQRSRCTMNRCRSERRAQPPDVEFRMADPLSTGPRRWVRRVITIIFGQQRKINELVPPKFTKSAARNLGDVNLWILARQGTRRTQPDIIVTVRRHVPVAIGTAQVHCLIVERAATQQPAKRPLPCGRGVRRGAASESSALLPSRKEGSEPGVGVILPKRRFVFR